MRFQLKNIIGSIIFLLGLLVLLNLGSQIFRPKNNTGADGMEEQEANGILAEPENTIDVLFIGDSVTYCAVMPIQLWRDHGITSYNCATSLQQLHYAKEFVEKTFLRQHPKVIILEATPIFYDFMYKENIADVIERALPILRYHDRWKDFMERGRLDSSLQVEYTHREIKKGYYFRTGVKVVEDEDYMKPSEEIVDIPINSRKTLLEIEKYCRERGAELILLSLPNALLWNGANHNTIQLLAEELGVDYIDMNYLPEEVPIDWSKDSFDGGDHLNYYGAQKVTAYLGNYLENMGIFEDKRTDSRYELWHNDTEKFYESVVK